MKCSVFSVQCSVGRLLSLRSSLSILAVIVGLSVSAAAQDTTKPKDDALDSLLEKLSEPSDRDRSARKAEKPATSKKEEPAGKEAGEAAKGKPAGAKDDKTKARKPGDSPSLEGKDQEVDELLQKLGETTDKPTTEDRPRGGPGGGEKREGQGGPQKRDPTDRSRLSGKDKETDEHLEELTGRRRRKKPDDGERTGPIGQLIKEMRDIEQKLSKPDTGETTRGEQKKVVKEIEKLIEEMRQSGGGSMRQLALRRMRRQNQRPGQQPGQTEGAMARGAPPTKPLKPTSKHSTAGGKDIWGHLPPELRAEIDNMLGEEALEAKKELIERYFLSVQKGKPVREDTP